jgi:hypothetical protein
LPAISICLIHRAAWIASKPAPTKSIAEPKFRTQTKTPRSMIGAFFFWCFAGYAAIDNLSLFIALFSS